MSTPPGWYQAQGDPPGTQRYWDGTAWIGNPTPTGPGTSGDLGQSGSLTPTANLASAGRRIGGRLVDLIIYSILGFVVIGLPAINTAFDSIDSFETATDAEIESAFETAFSDLSTEVLVFTVALWLLELLLVAAAGGTLGKLAVGTRVATIDSGQTPPPLPKAALRTASGALSAVITAASLGGAVQMILPVIGFVSLVLLFAHEHRRTVFDLLAGTVVVKR